MKPITVLNGTLSTIFFRVVYSVSGKSINSIDSSNIETTKTTSVNIPDDAYAIAIRVLSKTSTGSVTELATANIEKAETTCYELFGVDNNLVFQKIDCSKLSAISYIRIINKTDETIKGRLVYTVGKKGYVDESLELKRDKSRYFDIPIYAENIQFSVFAMDPKQGFNWRPLMSGNIKTPYTKCYEITGSLPNILFNEVKCPSLVGIVGVAPPSNDNTHIIIPNLEIPKEEIKLTLMNLDEAIAAPIAYNRCTVCKCTCNRGIYNCCKCKHNCGRHR